MTPAAARASYKRALGACETILIRRFTGQGTPRPKVEASCHARVTGYQPSEVVGTVLQGDRRLVVMAEDLEGSLVTPPLLASDKAVVRGKELAIIAIDDSTRRVGDTLCAYDLQVRG
jgi:hypothetical protein